MRTNGIFYTIIFFSVAMFLASCSNSSGSEIANLSDESLRSITDERENSILWTRELEAVRLTRNYKVNQMVSSKMALSPEAISFANMQRNFIYPSLDGFGSLDTSAISSEMRGFLNNTCTAISKWNLSTVKMASASEFSLILFKYDVEHLWQQLYKKSFPEIIAPPSVSSQAQSSETTDSDESKTSATGEQSELGETSEVENAAESEAVASETASETDNGVDSVASQSSAESEATSESDGASVVSSQSSAASATTTEPMDSASSSKSLPEGEGVFSSWLYGQPFFDEDIIEVPVRFYSSEGSLDVVLYVETDASFSVSQIDVLKMR